MRALATNLRLTKITLVGSDVYVQITIHPSQNGDKLPAIYANESCELWYGSAIQQDVQMYSNFYVMVTTSYSAASSAGNIARRP